MTHAIDDLDIEIIDILSADGRASASEIAQRIGKVSERTIRNRIAALLESRQIVISAIPDSTLTQPGVEAEVMIDVRPGCVESVAAVLAEYDQVGYLAATTGDFSLIASVFGDTNTDLLDFAETHIAQAEGVRRVNINLVMRLYKVFGTRTTALSKDSGASPPRLRRRNLRVK